MKNVPEKIYLQIDADGETPEDFNELQVSWCADRINENDIAYIREPSSPTVKDAPILDEAFSDNGEHSHWRLIDPKTGENLWSEDPKEDAVRGFPVKESETGEQEERIKLLEELLRKVEAATIFLFGKGQYDDMQLAKEIKQALHPEKKPLDR